MWPTTRVKSAGEDRHLSRAAPSTAPRGRRELAFRRVAARSVAILVDALVVVCAYVVALELRFDASIPALYAERFRAVAPVVAAIFVGSNAVFRLYARRWRYASLRDALVLAYSSGISMVLVLLADVAVFPLAHPIPLSVVPLGGLLAFLGMALVRFRQRILREVLAAFDRVEQSRVLIVGAGQAGQWLARELLYNPELGYRPICFVDDDPEKQGQRLHGLRVAGTRHEIRKLVSEQAIEVIVLALPSLSSDQRKAILAECEATTARIKLMPGLPDLLTDEPSASLMRNARLEDLIGRAAVSFEPRTAEWLGRCVLVTGAAGSIGSELARQLVLAAVPQVVLLDIDESGLFEIEAELGGAAQRTGSRLVTVIADVTRETALRQAFTRHRPSVVFHAAAYKHVPLMEAHPEAAVLTNVLGTLNLYRIAAEFGCERVVFISSDKAVAPANVMGATKRVGERLAEEMSRRTNTIFCSVRFGNVIGSRGSVVPTFLRQIRQGGPVTITHPEMKRFFMTIPEAVHLIIEAAGQAGGGEVFILDMGEPVNILELARKMIRLHGLRPGEDVAISQIGVRAGEKLAESLTGPGESVEPTAHPRVMRVVGRPAVGSSESDVLADVRALIEFAEQPRRPELLDRLWRLAEVPASGSMAAAPGA